MEEQKEIYEKKVVDTESIKCASCGSNLIFDPKTQMLYCEHCGRKESFEQSLKAEELSIHQGFEETKSWKEEAVVFRCENCGAKVVLDKSETAKDCPFCGTAHVVETDELAGIKPNAVLPFTLNKEDASASLQLWAKSKWLAPVGFHKDIKNKKLSGVYSPCFTFDSTTYSRYVGRIGKTHTRTVGSGKDQHTETYVVWQNISGNYNNNFDDVTITAGEKITQADLGKLAPFDTNNAKEYEKEFILGFMAYHYEKDIQVSWTEAKGIMDRNIKKEILSQYYYDEIDFLNISTSHANVTFKYVLLPIYVGNYTFKKKLFNFLVNGNTGRVTGKAPIAIWKAALLVLAGLGVVALAGWLGYIYLFSPGESGFVQMFNLISKVLKS